MNKEYKRFPTLAEHLRQHLLRWLDAPGLLGTIERIKHCPNGFSYSKLTGHNSDIGLNEMWIHLDNVYVADIDKLKVGNKIEVKIRMVD